MPPLVWLSLAALLYVQTSGSCVALAEAVATVSPDRLTRLLQSDWSGQTLLEFACRTLFTWDQGSLVLDDTVMAKPFATAIENLAWISSSQARQAVYGLSLVRLIWTEGTCRIPLGPRIGRKGGPSKDALARELLSDARHRLHCRPASVLFDAWYPSQVLRKRIHDYRYFVCRLKKNRRFKSQPRRVSRRPPDWAETGRLTGGLKVLVGRYSAKYFATHRLTLPAAAGRRLYRLRAQIEAVIRVCKNQRRLTGCQARSARAQVHHFTCSLVALCVLERERHDRSLTIDTLRRQLSCQGRTVVRPALERLRQTA